MDKKNQSNGSQVVGTLELNENGHGRLRSPKHNYGSRGTDPKLSADTAKKFRLRGGETIEGEVFFRKGGGNVPTVKSVERINGRPADEWCELASFDELTVIDPRKRLRFETKGGPLSMRVIDLLTPMGLGQRALIVAPPRTGKTVLLQQMAHALSVNHPDVYVMVLLIDERPEEVTDMRRNVHGEVVHSSNDHDVASHVRIARLMIASAKRRLESGEHVVILLDSLTRLGRAFNAAIRGGGRIMSGGLDIRALEEPKALFGAARNIEGGGSLTIIASSLIETGSRMDDVIFNEFKGTGNMEIVLSRNLANKRLWPAIDIQQSGTRKEELLLDGQELAMSHKLRREFINRPPDMIMENILERMGKFDSNSDFVATAK